MGYHSTLVSNALLARRHRAAAAVFLPPAKRLLLQALCRARDGRRRCAMPKSCSARRRRVAAHLLLAAGACGRRRRRASIAVVVIVVIVALFKHHLALALLAAAIAAGCQLSSCGFEHLLHLRTRTRQQQALQETLRARTDAASARVSRVRCCHRLLRNARRRTCCLLRATQAPARPLPALPCAHSCSPTSRTPLCGCFSRKLAQMKPGGSSTCRARSDASCAGGSGWAPALRAAVATAGAAGLLGSLAPEGRHSTWVGCEYARAAQSARGDAERQCSAEALSRVASASARRCSGGCCRVH